MARASIAPSARDRRAVRPSRPRGKPSCAATCAPRHRSRASARPQPGTRRRAERPAAPPSTSPCQRDPLDAKAFSEQATLRHDVVEDGDDRKVGATLLGGGVVARRRREPVAEQVRYHHEEALGIERTPRRDEPQVVTVATRVEGGEEHDVVARRAQPPRAAKRRWARRSVAPDCSSRSPSSKSSIRSGIHRSNATGIARATACARARRDGICRASSPKPTGPAMAPAPATRRLDGRRLPSHHAQAAMRGELEIVESPPRAFPHRPVATPARARS